MSDVVSEPAVDNPSGPRDAAVPIACPGCGQASGPDERFCGACGGRLWEPCVGCGSVNSVARRFCRDCGEPLEERLQSVLAECEQTLAQAEQMAAEGYYAQAIERLAAAPQVDHSRLAPLVERMTALSETYRAEHAQAGESAAKSLAEARELQAEGRLREAFEAARRTPPALRGREHSALHDELESQIALADRLREEIHSGVEARQYDGLLDKAERLATLDPWDQGHQELLKKLRERHSDDEEKKAVRAVKEARAFLKACEYRKAGERLAGLAQEALEGKAREKYLRCREKIWLANQAAKSPYITDAVLAAVDRLVKLQPHDERAKLLSQSMRKRRKKLRAERPGRPIPWVKPAELGEGEMAFENAGGAALLADGISQQGLEPGPFLEAFGLALQGIGRAEYAIDLAPPTKGVLGKIASVGGKKPAKSAWGIDIGSYSLKALRLTVDAEAAGGVRLDECVQIVHDRGEAAPPTTEAAALLSSEARRSFARFAEEHDLAGERVVIGLPGAQTLGRFFVAPYVSSSKYAKLMESETAGRIPVERDKVQVGRLDWEVGEEESQGVDQRRVALIAATNAHIESRADMVAVAKPARIEVTSNCLALANAVRFDRLSRDGAEEEVCAVVSIGAQSCNVVVPGGGDLWFRGLYGGTVAFDRALVKELGVRWSDAERLRHEPKRAKWMHEVDETLDSEFVSLAESIRRAISLHVNDSGRAVSRVLVGGGAVTQLGLFNRLRSADL